jgi:hypothetical protein
VLAGLRRRARVIIPVVVAAIAALALPSPSSAQNAGDLGGPTDGSADGGAGGAVAPAVRDEVELRVAKVGPGGRTRAGSWGGVLVEYRDSALTQREIVLRIGGLDRDGDPPSYQRTVVGDPERARSSWLYAPMPYPSQVGRLSVTAHEAIEADVPGGFRAGGVLGRAVIDTTTLVQGESPMIGVIGTRDAGLRQFAVAIAGPIRHTPLGNAATEVVTGLSIRDLPDRWQGLAPFGVLVWSRGGADTDPNALDAERARAVREWVTRGGHLVVLLPPVGQTWTAGGGRNPLTDILPAVRVERREGVSLEAYRPLLTLRADAPLPASAVVHTLTPAPDAARAEASAVLTGPDGTPVVTRRLVGQGMVTLIGLDIAADSLSALDTLDAEAIWHRVLGRRHSLDTFEQVKAKSVDLSAAVQQREVHDLDDDFERAIDFTGDAGKGVLLGLGVFTLYWLVAGPLGFYLLTKSGNRSRAWMGFLATSAVFTAIAWAGATVLRPSSIRATHLTFLDGVHGTGTQTASSWLSVLVPSYGEATIEFEGGSTGDLLSAWTPPPPAAGAGGFPDNRGYVVSARSPSSLTVPVRSTIKQIRAAWSGDPVANLPRPARQPGDTEEAALVLIEPDAGRVSGELVHGLPGPLENVHIVVVAGQRPLPVSDSLGPFWMPASVYSNTLAAPWAPGDRLDLGVITAGSPGDRNALGWLDGMRNLGSPRGFGADAPRVPEPIERRLTALSFLEMVGRADFLAARGQGRSSALPAVRDGPGLDLSRWFTQPCVIVVGHLVQDEEGALPIPLMVNGEAVPARGRTVVALGVPARADTAGVRGRVGRR